MVVNNPLIRLRLFSWGRVWGWVEFMLKFKIHKGIVRSLWCCLLGRSLDPETEWKNHGWSSILAYSSNKICDICDISVPVGRVNSRVLQLFPAKFCWNALTDCWRTGGKQAWTQWKLDRRSPVQYYSCRTWIILEMLGEVQQGKQPTLSRNVTFSYLKMVYDFHNFFVSVPPFQVSSLKRKVFL